MPGPVRIDVDHLGQTTIIRQDDMNLDSHPHAQRDGSRNQCPMTVDDDGLAFTGQRFSKTLGLDQNLQANPRASSGFTSAGLGGHYATCLCVVEERDPSIKSEPQMIHLSAGSKLTLLICPRKNV